MQIFQLKLEIVVIIVLDRRINGHQFIRPAAVTAIGLLSFSGFFSSDARLAHEAAARCAGERR
jgi:hypothetical protein